MLKRIFIFLSCLLITFSSCNYEETERPATTPAFDSILVKVERQYDAGNKKEAFKQLIASHATAEGLSLQDEMNYYSYVGSLYLRDMGDYANYIAAADSMIALLDKHNRIKVFSDRYYILAYNMKADGLFANGAYSESYEYYYKSKILAQKNSDSCSLSLFSYNLGMVQYKQQKYQDAALFFQESLAEGRSCPGDFRDFYHNQELLDNIGLSYSGLHKYDSALLYYKKAIEYIDTNFMRFKKAENVYVMAKAVVYGNMGNVYMALHQYDTAIALLKKSIDINLRKGYDNEDALLEQVKLATLYYNTGKIDDMKDLLTNIHAELDTIHNKGAEISWNRLMWNYYEHEHDPLNAYTYAKAYIVQNDSFLARNKVLMAEDLAGRIKSLERQNNLTLLKQDNEEKRLYLIIAAIVTVMSLIIVGLVLRNAVKSRKNIAKLTDLNNKVNEQNERLELALDGLEEKDKDKSRILRSVAHDVMNPIAAIQSLAEILISEADNYSDEHKEMLEMIREACNNSLGLSKDILEASIKIDPSAIEREWVDINMLVDSSVKLLGIQAQAKQQKIIVTSHDKNVQAYINKKKIWRVINNLIGNAIKFSYEKSEIEIHIVRVLDKVHISVVDHGIGIPEKTKPHIFDMFTEAKLPGTSGEVPHGLGLSISLQIAKAHKGNIWFESEAGKGTTFHFALPLNING